MSEVKIYLKPRPVYGHANYLPFQWHPDFKYGPFFAGYGTIPSDATEEYTIHSPNLSAAIAAFHNQLVPSLQTEVPEITRSLWPSLVELERTIMRPCDHTPFPLPTELCTDPEWDELFISILARGDHVELRDADIDTEVEIFVWAYMHYMAFYFCTPWLKFQRDLRHPEESVSLDTFRAKALVLPSEFIRKGNTNNQPSVSNAVTPSSLLRRRNRSMTSEEANLA
ncbi:hypothetical protein EDD85DRAFT_1004812 [Armillaria nabsnona]|nr:hypothetical protein EDD85DRAFT_1004812 [Armillaria nabsnona]